MPQTGEFNGEAHKNKNTQIVEQDAHVREETKKKWASVVTDNIKNMLADGGATAQSDLDVTLPTT